MKQSTKRFQFFKKILNHFDLIVGCYNPNATLKYYNMQLLTISENNSSPFPDSTVLFTSCLTNYIWNDIETVKNITCINNRWTAFPTPCLSILLIKTFYFLKISLFFWKYAFDELKYRTIYQK